MNKNYLAALVLGISSICIAGVSHDTELIANRQIKSHHDLWLWQPPTEVENTTQRVDLFAFQKAIERLIESGKYSFSTYLRLLYQFIFKNQNPTTRTIQHTEEFPYSCINQCGAGGSKSSSSSQSSQKDTKDKPKTPVFESKATVSGQSFTLISAKIPDVEQYHILMQEVISETLTPTASPIGEGATSFVHKMEVNGKIFAVKQAKTKKDIKLIIEEGSSMLELNHPNVLALELLAFSDSTALLVFEYYPSDLWERLFGSENENSTPPQPSHEQVLNYLKQLVAALDYLHALGLSHRDLKPENILIKEDDTLVLSDLGNLGRLHDHGKYMTSGIYAAPEVHRHETPPGMLSDIWEFGIIICLLLNPAPMHLMLRNERAGYMNVWEQITIYSEQAGVHTEWLMLLGETPVTLKKGSQIPPDRDYSSLTESAFLYLIATISLRLCPEDRPNASELKQLLADFLLSKQTSSN